MTIECYYHWCPCHSGDEPFCKLDDCTASEEELCEYRSRRELYLASKGLPPDFDFVQEPTRRGLTPDGKFWLSYVAACLGLVAYTVWVVFF